MSDLGAQKHDSLETILGIKQQPASLAAKAIGTSHRNEASNQSRAPLPAYARGSGPTGCAN
jgi:hypothetical protein